MSRSVAWRRIVSDVVSLHQDEALEATIFILREVGPTGFLLQEEGQSKKSKVFLGDPHSCTCSDFRKDSDLCKHICWVLLKKFRLKREDPISWQHGLVEREIQQLLQSYHSRKQLLANPRAPSQQPPAAQTETADDGTGGDGDPATPGGAGASGGVVQRAIAAEDLCPICQEEMLASRLPVTFCRHGCGNSVHIRCMRVWSEHQRKQKPIGPHECVSCPMCRGDFAPISLLMREVAQNNGSLRGGREGGPASVVHQGTECGQCVVSPVKGKVYKCEVCTNFLLCAVCFNTAVHTQHEFIFRERSHARWQPAPRSRSLPSAVVTSLQARDLSEEDYDLLLQLDVPAVGSDLRQSDLDQLSSWRIRSETSRLLTTPGLQCRLCLMAYRPGDQVRRLPDCRHVFHAACIDPWLLHRRPACPIDGGVVVCGGGGGGGVVNVPVSVVSGSRMEEGAGGRRGRSGTELLVVRRGSTGINISGLSVNGARVSSVGRQHFQQHSPSTNTSTPDSTPSATTRPLPGASSSLQPRVGGCKIPPPRHLPPLSSPSVGSLENGGTAAPPPLPVPPQSAGHGLVVVNTAPSIPAGYRGINHNLSLGVGSANNFHPPLREQTRLRQPHQLRTRSHSASREEKERSKAYASDPRLQNAIRKLELFAKSYNIPLD